MSLESSRRDFLRRCAASAFSVSAIPYLGSSGAIAAANATSGPGFGSAKNVILVMLNGGLSQGGYL